MADVTNRKPRVSHSAKPSKYHARKTTVDGIVFDSAKEARRYEELKIRLRGGEIHDLEIQPEFTLDVYGRVKERSIGVYRADFKYCECRRGSQCILSQLVIEDVKGFKTPLYRWKKKHVEAQYNITIRET